MIGVTHHLNHYTRFPGIGVICYTEYVKRFYTSICWPATVAGFFMLRSTLY